MDNGGFRCLHGAVMAVCYAPAQAASVEARSVAGPVLTLAYRLEILAPRVPVIGRGARG